MEIKLFAGADPLSVEKEVSSWLKEQGGQVQHVAQSQCERQGKLVFIISVFYSPAGSAAGSAHSLRRASV